MVWLGNFAGTNVDKHKARAKNFIQTGFLQLQNRKRRNKGQEKTPSEMGFLYS